MNRLLKTGAVAALSAIVSSTAWAALPDFHSVDFIYAQNPQLFQDLFTSAQSQTVRIAIFGDSQETSPTSQGYRYFPRLNYEMWKRYGNSPETPIEGCFYYATTPPGDWLMTGACTAPGQNATRISADRILPNVVPKAISTLNGATNISGGTKGQLTLLTQDASTVSSDAQIPTSTNYFNTSGIVKARIFAATNASSGDVGYQTRPTDNASPSYAAAMGQPGTLGLTLQSGTFDVKSGDTSQLSFAGKKYVQLEVFGASDSTYTDIVGLRFFNQSHPEGVVFDTFSKGGYTAQLFLQNHANAGAMFKAQGFHAALIHYGANEGGGVTAAQFQTDIASLISQVRTWAADASLPVILIADVYEDPATAPLTSTEQAEYDKYVGAQLAIAQADSHVMVINSRRLMEDIGWKASGGQASNYLLSDGIHYTANGAIVLAAAEVAAMMNEVNVASCLTDTASLHFSAATQLNVTLGGTTACSGYGRLTMSGTLTLDQPTLNVTLGNSFVPAVGQQFKILAFSSASGTFGTINLPTLAAGLHWNTSALYTTGTIAVSNQMTPAPTVSITSGGSQTVTRPDTPTAIAFTLTGSQPLTVIASSPNTTLFPNGSITVSSGCGTSTLTCTATPTPAAGQNGNATITLSATDPTSQAGQASTSITINAAVTQPPPPGSPTLTVTSGGSQSITLPAAPAAVAFTLTGTRPLTVAATSSNTTLLPTSGIAISAGCGSSTLSCSATLTPASNQTGSATITFTVSDSVPQSATGTANLTVSPASSGGGGGGSGGGSSGGGGGGAIDLITLIALSLGLLAQRMRPPSALH